MVTYWCKGCRKLEQREEPINVFASSSVIVDGKTYRAIYAHPRSDGKVEKDPAFIQWVWEPGQTR
jgi:hypothetical protein